MRLKLYSRNLARLVLLFSFLGLVLLNGCQNSIEPTYKEDQIPQIVKKICKDEYSLDVTTKRVGSTLWIYAPLQKILHKEFGQSEDKIFDDDMAEKLRNILTTVGRVLISSDNSPEFYALLASDVNLGIDYAMIGSALDIKKSYSGFIAWPEANKRYVIQFNLEPMAIDDYKGSHLKPIDIKMPDFLALQIAQRISGFFQSEGNKNNFKVEKVEGRFNSGAFIFDYSITQTGNLENKTDIKKEILKTIAYCVKTYDFRDFFSIELTDLATKDKIILNQAAILDKSTE